jgi:hypothetical protein
MDPVADLPNLQDLANLYLIKRISGSDVLFADGAGMVWLGIQDFSPDMSGSK